MRQEVFVNQKPDTPAPSDSITGIITEQQSKGGSFKFKKDREGKTYSILNCSEPREWKNDFGTFKTYYLTLEDEREVYGTDKKTWERGGDDRGRDVSGLPADVAGEFFGEGWKTQVETSIKALKKAVEDLQKASGTGSPPDENTPTRPSDAPEATKTPSSTPSAPPKGKKNPHDYEEGLIDDIPF